MRDDDFYNLEERVGRLERDVRVLTHRLALVSQAVAPDTLDTPPNRIEDWEY
jgi:hypothetical protein